MAHFMHAYSAAPKGALLNERSFGSSLGPLSFGVPPDKCPKNSNTLLNIKNLCLKLFNNVMAEELMVFDSDSYHLHLGSCVTGSITGFKSDFVEGSYAKVAEKIIRHYCR